MTGIIDSSHRHINYMRVSVTDRCNLNCVYCSYKYVSFLARNDILRYEEIHRVAQAAARLGVNKIRLTGGEPLIRRNLNRLVKLLANINGINEVSLTTNGTLLAKYATELKAAGLKRVNISLDTLRPDRFQCITDSDKLHAVLKGIEVAKKAKLNPVKVNMVVLRGINDDEILDFAYRTITHGWHVRYIEHIPFTNSGIGSNKLVAIDEIIRVIQGSLGKPKPYGTSFGNGPARYYQLSGATGTIGFIGAITDCFCAECNRFRLTADGSLRPCLLADDELDIKGSLRAGASIEELEKLMREATALKGEKHHFGEKPAQSKRQMRRIGG